MDNFLHNISLTAKSRYSLVLVISPVVLFTSHYIHELHAAINPSHYVAFLYHSLLFGLILMPLALSASEESRFEDLGYTFPSGRRSIGVRAGYHILGSIIWSYISNYWLNSGTALVAALDIINLWTFLIGAFLIPLWILARPQEARSSKGGQGHSPSIRMDEGTGAGSTV
jgi:hypothetical protein